jgi:hypothetical protein
MDNKLIAYNSKAGRVMLVVLDLALLIAAILSVQPFDAHIVVTVLLTAAFIGVAIITVRILSDISPIAFTCDEEGVVIHKAGEETVIPFSEITEVFMNEADNGGGFFDAILLCGDKRYVMNYLIKDRAAVSDKFHKILEAHKINISVREVSEGGD